MTNSNVGIATGFFDVVTAVGRTLFATFEEHRLAEVDVYDEAHCVSTLVLCDDIVDTVAFVQLGHSTLYKILPPPAVNVARHVAAAR